MGKVQDSMSRLEEAIGRLERASRLAGDGDAKTRKANAVQPAIADAAAARLDAMISRIDRVLEG